MQSFAAVPGAGPCQEGLGMGQCGAAESLALFSVKNGGKTTSGIQSVTREQWSLRKGLA